MNKSHLTSMIVIFVCGLSLGIVLSSPIASLSGRAAAYQSSLVSAPQSTSGSSPAGTQAWEYRILDVLDVRTKTVERDLNTLGYQGFEVSKILPSVQGTGGVTGGPQFRLLLRRPRP